MNDITHLMDTYRECVRHLWNTYFQREAELRQDWDLRDQFCDASLLLFRALVLRGVGREDAGVLPDYHGDQQPLMCVQLHVEPRSEIMVNRSGAGGYWDDPVKLVEAGECDLRFIRFFDWSDLSFRDFAFYRVRIVGSSRYPHLVGRDALLPVTTSVKVFCERGAQQGDEACPSGKPA